jgi:hypothetical protein
MKASRYIKTKVDGAPRILHMDKCNLCPLLYMDMQWKMAKCSKFGTQGIFLNTIDYNVYSYSCVGKRCVPIKEISIPNWCGLPEDVLVIHQQNETYVKSGEGHIVIPNTFGNMVVVSSKYVQYDPKLTKLVYIIPKGTKTDSTKSKELPAHVPSTPTVSTCSSCGKMVENVNRKKNFGMCPKCWDENKDNEEMKQFAFINNFRLKRCAYWSDESFKPIKEIS